MVSCLGICFAVSCEFGKMGIGLVVVCLKEVREIGEFVLIVLIVQWRWKQLVGDWVMDIEI